MEVDAAGAGGASQRARALEHAARVRVARADLERRVATGQLHVAEVVLARPWMAERMQLDELLMCQPRWGRKRSQTFLASVGFAETKMLGSLTERQCLALAVLLSTKESAR
jgi:hypothetical protein